MFFFPLASQQQQKLALPPQQTEAADATAEKAPDSSEEPEKETPMEQENPEGETSSEPKTENTSESESRDPVDHTKMPEHPGRDSDSDEEDNGEEQ